MHESKAIALERVSPTDIDDFQKMANEYWQELMPHAQVVNDAEQRQVYFHQRFWDEGANRHLYWAVADEHKVGFLMVELSATTRAATVEDFYVTLPERRKGYGTAMVRALCAQLDRLNIELIELNVRRDNPRALAFWEAQGFRIALFRLRQYRDPMTGTGFIGALSSDFEPGSGESE